MPSRIHCPECNSAFAYSSALLGKNVRCQKCQHAFTVTQPPTEEPTAAPSQTPTSTHQPVVPPPLPRRANLAKPARSSRRDELIDDDRPSVRSDDYDRPRPRRRPAEIPERSSGVGMLVGVIALFVVGFLILAVGIGYLLWPSSAPNQPIVQGPEPASDPLTPIAPPRGLNDIMKDQPLPVERPGFPGRPNGPRPAVPPPAGIPELPAFPNLPPFPEAPPGIPGRPALPSKPPLAGPNFVAIVPLPIKPTPFTTDRTERVMPGPIESITVAGGGRLLLLHMPRERKIAVFDVNTGQRAKYIAVEDDRAKIAGGMNVFVVYLSAKNLLERYNCSTLELKAEIKAPFPADVLALAMGNASNGPLVAALSGTRRTFHGGATLGYFDPTTGKEVGYEKAGEENHFGLGLHNPTTTGVRVSPEGSVIVGYGGPAPQVDVIDGGRIMRYWKHGGPDGMSVAADGQVLFAQGHRYSQNLKPLDENAPRMPDGVWFLPSVSGDYFVALRAVDDRRGPFGSKKATANVYLGAEGKSILSIGELPNFEVPSGFEARSKSFDQDVLLVPEAKMLVVVPTKTRDRIVLYRADLDAALAKATFDYFSIVSRPPTLAVKGEEYRYTVVAKSKKGGIKVVLDSGPKGMVVSPAGDVTWSVPKNLAESESTVILKATDASGKELFQSFRLRVKARTDVPNGTKSDPPM